MAKKSQPTVKRDEFAVSEDHISTLPKGHEEEKAELLKIVNRVADIRLDEIEAEMLRVELIEEGERHEEGNVINGLFRLWKLQMTNLDVGDPYYLRLKARMLDIFDEKEFETWMYGEELYLQKVVWLVHKKEDFCRKYGVRRQKVLGLMKCLGWSYIMTHYSGPEWKSEIERQVEKRKITK